MLDKTLVKAELNSIFNLMLASIDKSCLLELIANKFADKREEGVASVEYTRKAWNKGIQVLINENNQKHKDKTQIEVPKGYDFFSYVYNKLKRSGQNQAEAQEGASWVLYYCFIPGAAARIRSKFNKPEQAPLFYDTLVRKRTPDNIVKEYDDDSSVSDVITHFRKTLDKGKHDEHYTLVSSFQSTANIGINKWYDFAKDLREDQPSRKKEDSDEYESTLEEIGGADQAIDEILVKRLKKDFFDFVEEEKKEGLISNEAYSYLNLKENDPDMKREKLLKELKLIPKDITEENKEELLKDVESEYQKILNEIKYIFARYAYANDDADLLAAMKRKDPKGRILLPSNSNKSFNPNQTKFTKKNWETIADFLDDNYDKSYTVIRKEFVKLFNPKLVAKIDALYKEEDEDIKKLLDAVDRYKRKANKTSSYDVISYLEELISRLS